MGFKWPYSTPQLSIQKRKARHNALRHGDRIVTINYFDVTSRIYARVHVIEF